MALNAGQIAAVMDLDIGPFTNKLNEAQNKTGGFEQKLSGYGDKFTSIGTKMTVGITAPVAAMGLGMAKTTMDFDYGMSKVQALSGATGAEMEALRAKAKEMGATTKFSASESAEALGYMGMAGWNSSQMIDALPGVMNLAAASGENLGTVSDIVTDAMTAFGLEANQAAHFADVLAVASSKSNTNVGLLGESFKYVAPVAGSMGYAAEDVATALGLMANAGIKGSQAGTALRSSILRLASPTNDTAAAMAELGIEMYNLDGSAKPLHEVMGQLRTSFDGLTDAEKASFAEALFGKEAVAGMLAVIDAGEDDFNNLSNSINNADGAAENMAKTMEDNLKGKITELKSQFEGVAIQLGEQLIPHLQNGVKWISNMVSKFAELSPETQGTILKFIGLAAAAGPVLTVGGKLMKVTGSVIGLFSKLSAGSAAASAAAGGVGAASAGAAGGLGAMAAGLGSTLLAIAPWAIAIGAAGYGAYKLYKHLSEDAIPAMDLFGEGVSDATAKAVGGFLELDTEATNALNRLKWSGGAVTEELKNTVTNNITQMKDQVVGALETQKEEGLKTIEGLLTEGTKLTDQEGQKLIAAVEKNYEDRITKTQYAEERINGILENAANNNRQLTEQEVESITRLREEMKENGVRVLSESEEEYAIIMQRIADQGAEISAHGAAEVVKASLEQKNKTIAAAEEEYDERIRLAAELKAQGGKENEELANKIIEEAQRQRDGAVEAAEEMHEKVVAEAQAQASEYVNEIDWSTGEVLSKWDILKKNAGETFSNIKETTVKYMKDSGKEIQEAWETAKKKVTDWWDDLSTAATNRFDEISQNVSKFTENATTWFSDKWDTAKSTVSNIWDALFGKNEESMENINNTTTQNMDQAAQNATNSASDMESNVSSSMSTMDGNVDTATSNAERNTSSRLGSMASSATSNFGTFDGAVQGSIGQLQDFNNQQVQNKKSTWTFTRIFETIGNVFNAVTGRNAHGTNFWSGGLTWVGEQGPELVELPQGAKVHSNQKSNNMSGIDYEKLGAAVAKALEKTELTAKTYLNGKDITDYTKKQFGTERRRAHAY